MFPCSTSMGGDEFISGTVSIPSKLIIISNIAMEVAISHAQTRIYLRHRRWDTRLHKTCPWIQEGPLNTNTTHTTSSLARASSARTDLCVCCPSQPSSFLSTWKMMPKPAETKGKTNTYFPGRTATFEPTCYSCAYNLYDDVLASVTAQTARVFILTRGEHPCIW